MIQSKFPHRILKFGYFFLYAPILYLIVFSFNASKIPGIWKGFTFKWYITLFEDDTIIEALLTSIKIASFTATGAVIIGILASVVTIRLTRFRGQRMIGGFITSPMIMPEVIIGLALLMTFVALEHLINWPGYRGVLTVIIAHITLTTAYAFLMIQTRLRDFDLTLEEAAMDLGAKPFTVFFKVTLPVMFPTLFAAWLLAFALSLDDVVIASFLAGPGATTLPMVIFSSIRVGVSPAMNALATLLVTVISLGVLATSLYLYRRNKINT